jgi:hypothetical protein
VSKPALDVLINEGVIERVDPDPDTARQELRAARAHVESAVLIAGGDPTGAFAMAYDAMRKAFSAHMRATGYRATTGKGHHYRTGRYALVALRGRGVEGHVEAFDDLRQLRNQSQYDALMVEPDDVTDILAHAEALVAAIEVELGR